MPMRFILRSLSLKLEAISWRSSCMERHRFLHLLLSGMISKMCVPSASMNVLMTSPLETIRKVSVCTFSSTHTSKPSVETNNSTMLLKCREMQPKNKPIW